MKRPLLLLVLMAICLIAYYSRREAPLPSTLHVAAEQPMAAAPLSGRLHVSDEEPSAAVKTIVSGEEKLASEYEAFRSQYLSTIGRRGTGVVSGWVMSVAFWTSKAKDTDLATSEQGIEVLQSVGTGDYANLSETLAEWARKLNKEGSRARQHLSVTSVGFQEDGRRILEYTPGVDSWPYPNLRGIKEILEISEVLQKKLNHDGENDKILQTLNYFTLGFYKDKPIEWWKKGGFRKSKIAAIIKAQPPEVWSELLD